MTRTIWNIGYVERIIGSLILVQCDVLCSTPLYPYGRGVLPSLSRPMLKSSLHLSR